MTREISKIEVKNLHIDSYLELKDAMSASYPDWSDVSWDESHIRKLLKVFPEGQLTVMVDGKVVGCALSLIINYADFGDDHTYNQITGNDTFDTHSFKGDVLYGIDIFVHPDYRGLRIGRRLYEARKEVCERLNLRAIIFGGRIPNYGKYADRPHPARVHREGAPQRNLRPGAYVPDVERLPRA